MVTYVAFLVTSKANLLLELQRDAVLRITHDGSDRRDMNTLAVSHLAFTPGVVDQVRVDRHDLCLKKVVELGPEDSETWLCPVHGLN